MSEWRDKLRRFLIDGGTDGRSQRDITYYLNNVATAEELLSHLEAWRVEGKVDKYNLPTGGRTGTVWRATTRILNELTKDERDEIGMGTQGDIRAPGSRFSRKRAAIRGRDEDKAPARRGRTKGNGA